MPVSRLLPASLRWHAVLLDGLGASLAHTLAYLLRFEGEIPQAHAGNFLLGLLLFTVVKLAGLHLVDRQRGIWRYTGLGDLLRLARVLTLASLVMLAILLFAQRFEGFSRSVFLLDWLFTLLALGGLRVGARVLHGPAGALRLRDWPSWLDWRSWRRPSPQGPPPRRCVILGAGEAGEKLARDIQDHPETGLALAGFFDDNPAKQGLAVHGVPVLGGIETLGDWQRQGGLQAAEAFIAMPSASGPAIRRIVDVCDAAGLPCRTIPSLRELAQGRVSVKALRDVDYRDLLPREEARPDVESLRHMFSGRRVMVTGAGGSIGSELCRRLVDLEPASLDLVDMSESALHAIQMELAHEHGFSRHLPQLGDLHDAAWTDWLLETRRPEIILHAAAYKHVPMLEWHPWQAVTNNVLATAHLLEAAEGAGVGTLLVVSTDKAVRPTSVMGASKRLAERLMLAHCRSSSPMRRMAVRFGNVLGSSGSVIPLFRRQIEHGGPVTVTHPDVVRYFMTVEEACLLILQAATMGGAGEIFLLKMGRPVNIAQMAADLIRLSGREPGRDVAIQFVGLRPGEKLFEELVTEGEGIEPTPHEQLMVLRGEGCSLDDLRGLLDELAEAARRRDGDAIRRLLRRGVPEYAGAPDS